MTVHKLDNAGWGFPSNCFVCEASNDRGLKVPFFYDDCARLVTAELCVSEAFSGTPKYVHGGVTLAVLDEAMAWAVIAMAHVFAVTKSITASFERPVLVDGRYRVEATLVDDDRRSVVRATAAVNDSAGQLCVRAEAELAILSSEQADSAIGPLGGRDALYVRGRSTTAAEGPTEPA